MKQSYAVYQNPFDRTAWFVHYDEEQLSPRGDVTWQSLADTQYDRLVCSGLTFDEAHAKVAEWKEHFSSLAAAQEE